MPGTRCLTVGAFLEAGVGEYVPNVTYRADGNPHEILDERKGLRLGHLRHWAIDTLRKKVGDVWQDSVA